MSYFLVCNVLHVWTILLIESTDSDMYAYMVYLHTADVYKCTAMYYAYIPEAAQVNLGDSAVGMRQC